jgi:hypothetical protein
MRILALAAVAIAVLCADSAGAQSLKDDFDKGSLDPTKWTKKQITDAQISFAPDSRCGLSAIEITAREGDGGQQCGNACERAELRTAKSSWPSFGQEVWYRFSFRIDGDIPTIGSARTVIGQWKGPGDGSPMLAQRFDNGVFHITVQDNDNRRVVASAEGNYDDVQTVEASPTKPVDHDEKDVNASMDSPARYSGGAQIDVIPEKDAVLPDPRKGWVDMVYRIKPGRSDNDRGPRGKGEIDIWANGKKIVSVRGNIGATLKHGGDEKLVGPYFKFGVYRSSVPGTLRFRFDEFSQATSREGLPMLCPAK